jgi:hypothetical protein
MATDMEVWDVGIEAVTDVLAEDMKHHPELQPLRASHIPRPWRLAIIEGHRCEVLDANDEIVLVFRNTKPGDRSRTIALFIVTTINAMEG